MKLLLRIVVAAFAVTGVVAVGTALFLLRGGLTARREPPAVEAFLARRARRLGVPGRARAAKNPVALTPEALAEARAHFADHCAICHGNDGSGDTEIGRNLYPRAPDMRLEATQSLTDGELFYFIAEGVPFTGMPAWGGGEPADAEGSWKLVHFIRHLPDLTPGELGEMRRLNPKSAHELEEEEEIRRFLQGEAAVAGSKWQG